MLETDLVSLENCLILLFLVNDLLFFHSDPSRLHNFAFVIVIRLNHFMSLISQVETITRQKLKNPNVFVSATRLCIRNIPVNVDDQSLRKTFLKACGNPKSRITEVSSAKLCLNLQMLLTL